MMLGTNAPLATGRFCTPEQQSTVLWEKKEKKKKLGSYWHCASEQIIYDDTYDADNNGWQFLEGWLNVKHFILFTHII